MSVRRAKMQIKPKVSTRSMTSMAITSDKPTVDSTDKAMDTSAKEDVAINESCFTTLTTKLIPVFDDQTSDSNDDNNDNNDTNNRICETESTGDQNKDHSVDSQPKVTTSEVIELNKEVDPPVVPVVDIESKESESDSKRQKESENKSKFVSKTAKEVNRKRKMSRKSDQKSDKASMRMKDLLLYNPPLTEEQKEMRDKDEEQTDRQMKTDSASEESENKVEEKQSNDTNSEANDGPRVKVGADGQLILDEESVIVKRKRSVASREAAVVETAGTTSACTNYASFRSKTKSSSKPRWSEHETIRFYSALNTIGTDFTLMANLFFRGKRTRLDLRNKFKKEEKVNKLMIDEALFSPNTFINQCPELDELLNSSASDTDEDEEVSKQTKPTKQTKQKAKTTTT